MLAVVYEPEEGTTTFEELVREHRARIYGICYRYVGNPADADDLAQDVLLKVYRGLPTFRGDARLSTWIYRIAVNTCLNWISARKGRTDELPDDLVDKGLSPAERLYEREVREVVQAAIRKLPDRQRMTLVLRVYEELTHKEIAEAMSCPVGTAKANLFFALKNLRKHLGNGVDSPGAKMV